MLPSVSSGEPPRGLTAALAYAAKGWSVFPCHSVADGRCSCGADACSKGKHPLTARGLHDAVMDEATIRAWWAQWPHANVAIRTGRLPDGKFLFVLDVDTRHEGDENLGALEHEHGEIPHTARVVTGSGGTHYFMSCAFDIPCSTSRLGHGIDVRCTGGYVVAPPSSHTSGREYAEDAGAPLLDTPLADVPRWLRILAASKPRGPSGDVAGIATPLHISEGGRNATLTSLAGAMRRRGMGPEAIFAGIMAHNLSHCLPPLDEREVRKIANGMARYAPAPAPAPAAADEHESAAGQSARETHIITHNYQGHELDEAVRVGIVALSKTGHVYQSSGRLVSITRDPVIGRCKNLLAQGSPRITILEPSVLRSALCRRIVYHKFSKTRGQWEPCQPPSEAVMAIHDQKAWDDSIPTVVGISESPVVAVDGTIADAPGYDHVSGYWLELGETFPRVQSAPTQADAAKAFRRLSEAFQDFGFERNEQAVVPIAAICTVLARPYLSVASVPGFVFDAATGGEGKTLLTDVIATIATGRPASRTAYPPTDEESGKVLSAYALFGASIISVDDIKRPLGGENLDRVLTTRDTVDFRLLGKTQIIQRPWRAVMMFTGNNVSYAGQTARRVCVARLESGEERPQDRVGWAHDPLLPWVAERRQELVVAALTLLRAYVVAGAPDMGLGTWGSFVEWAKFIPGALVYAGGANVLECRPDSIGDSDDTDDLATIILELERLCLMRNGGNPMGSAEIVASAGTDLKAALQGEARKLTTQLAGMALKRTMGRVVVLGGRKLSVRRYYDKCKKMTAGWYVKTM